MIAAERVTASIITTTAELEALEDAWNALLDGAATSHFNMRPLWQLAWWRHFGDGHSLRAIACRDASGALTGLVPLYLAGDELRFIGCAPDGPANGRATLIARRGDEAAVVAALAECLHAEHDWTHLWLAQLNSDDPFVPLLAGTLGPASEVKSNPAGLFVDTRGDWETHRKSLGKSGRKRVQRYGRHAAAHGFVFRRATSLEEVLRAFELYLQWHAERLSGDGVYQDPRSVSFLREMVMKGFAEGRVRVWVAELDGVIAAVDFCIVDRGVLSPYQGHIDLRFAPFRLGHVLTSRILQDCFDDSSIDSVMLGQPALEKRFWTDRETTSCDLTYARLRP